MTPSEPRAGVDLIAAWPWGQAWWKPYAEDHADDQERVERLEEERDTVLRRLNLKLGEGDIGREERERLKDIETALDCQPPAGQEEESWHDVVLARDEDGAMEVAWLPGDDVDVRGEYEQGGFTLRRYVDAEAPNVLTPDEAQDIARYLEGSGREEIQKLWLRLKDYGKEHHAGH